MTEEQKKNLHKAIDLAKKPGACKYTELDEPICPIAQLLVLEGIPGSELPLGSTPVDFYLSRKKKGKTSLMFQSTLKDYPLRLLTEVQKVWDGQSDHPDVRLLEPEDRVPTPEQEELMRKTMHRIVDEWSDEELATWMIR